MKAARQPTGANMSKGSADLIEANGSRRAANSCLFIHTVADLMAIRNYVVLDEKTARKQIRFNAYGASKRAIRRYPARFRGPLWACKA